MPLVIQLQCKIEKVFKFMITTTDIIQHAQALLRIPDTPIFTQSMVLLSSAKPACCFKVTIRTLLALIMVQIRHWYVCVQRQFLS